MLKDFLQPQIQIYCWKKKKKNIAKAMSLAKGLGFNGEGAWGNLLRGDSNALYLVRIGFG